MKEQQHRENPWALLPIGVFLVIFLGFGCVTGDFYSMPAIVGFLLALLVGFLQNRRVDFQGKIRLLTEGIADENIVTMCLIFLVAGAFSKAVDAAGGAESAVNLGLSVMPANVAVVGLFVISCFISISMGTSMGTIAAMAPIAAGISAKGGMALPLCAGAVMCGAMFGDNLSMISDTTIAAVRTQGCEMKDKFRENFCIVLPAAIVTAILLLIVSGSGQAPVLEKLDYHPLKVLPYVVVLVGAVIGFNVFLVLLAGIVLSLVIGVLMGSIAVGEMFTVLGEGVTSMYDITVISLVVAFIVALVRANGGIAFILSRIRKRVRGKRGAELGIGLLVLLVDCCTANNTVAIVMTGPIAREISQEYGIDPKRSASLLDIFASVGQGLIPYGAQLLSAAALTGLTPFAILPYMFYPVLMAVSAVLFIFLRKRGSEEKI